MKNLSKLIIIAIMITLGLSSCKNGTYITKRKYTKGYYVNHSHKKADVEPNKIAKQENTIKAEPVAVEIVKPVVAEDVIEKKIPVSEPVIAEEPVKMKNKHFVSEKENEFELSPTKVFILKQAENIMPSGFSQAGLAEKMSPEAGIVAATLSLFWIVLVVILLFYLVALVFDGFGIGWAIHLFLLLFLILLILWLLGEI